MENNKETLDRLEMKWNLHNAFEEMTPEQRREKVMEYLAQKEREKIYFVG